MDLAKIDLIIHPVRLRILQTLANEQLTTQEISERLADVPTSSIYRHLKLLLEGGMVSLAETRLVHGIQEKVYELAEPASLGREELGELTTEEHFRYFLTYVMTLLRDFANYLAMSADEEGCVDMAADYAGYREISFFASEEELLTFFEQLNKAALPLLENRPAENRQKHKLVTVTHPVLRKKGEQVPHQDERS